MAGWYTASCGDCGGELHIHEDWSNPPSICKSCKEKRNANWYDKTCEGGCGGTLRICKDWEHPPRFCKSCKDNDRAKWYEKTCEGCGGTMKLHRDWEHPPVFCKPCKDRNPPQYKNCNHCGSMFTIPTGTIINCNSKGWDLPNRCSDCRELFKYKPFTTEKMQGMFNTVYWRTCNSRGQLISESRLVDTVSGKYLEHRSANGHVTGRTREREGLFGHQYKETRGVDGHYKSESHEREGPLGNKYSESTGGSSNTHHTTRTVNNVVGSGTKRRTD